MKSTALKRLLLASFVLLFVSANCQLAGQVMTGGQAPTEEAGPAGLAPQEPTGEAPVMPSPTDPPAAAQETAPPEQPVPTEVPSEAPPTSPPPEQTAPEPAPPAGGETIQPCSGETCTASGSFLLVRPVGANGRVEIDPSNRFGEYQKRTRDSHHGVDFLNSTGTPVVAAADGVVVAAGDDHTTGYGLNPDSYGNLVILKHSLPGIAEPVFTLYAHLSEVGVQVDQQVTAGQEIGKVGMSGMVSGSTLHFEVRVGDNQYGLARNPELWLAPRPDETGQPMGALAGRVVDAEDKPLEVTNVVLERLGGPGQPALDQYYLRTYSDKDQVGLSPGRKASQSATCRPGSTRSPSG
jgi:murein DD-endopeptidase MepM/ murein hydrolase activator NlpD